MKIKGLCYTGGQQFMAIEDAYCVPWIKPVCTVEYSGNRRPFWLLNKTF